MKLRSAKSIMLSFFLIILCATIGCNYYCLSYYHKVNNQLVLSECNKYTENIRGEIEQKFSQLEAFSNRIYLELFRLDFFDSSGEENKQYNHLQMQDCADLLNELTEVEVNLIIINYEDEEPDNYSRVFTQGQIDSVIEKYEIILNNTSDDFGHYQIVEMEGKYLVVYLLPFFKYDYSTLSNKEEGYILCSLIIEKGVLNKKYNLPPSTAIYLHEVPFGKKEDSQYNSDRNINNSVSATCLLETNNENFNVSCVLQKSDDILDFSSIRNIILLINGCILLLTVLCLYALFWYIAKPLNFFSNQMLAIANNTNDRMPEHFFCDELNILSSHFNEILDSLEEKNKMVLRSKQHLYEVELCEKERCLNALRSQINPHFIYNMLENIRVLSAMGRNEDVNLATIQIAKFLRYSLYVRGFVKIQDEIEATKSYLEVLKLCYDNMFQVKYSVEKELNTAMVPKMVIQPLVENIFKHGFEFDNSDNVISIDVKKENENIVISVRDNGCGISPEKLDRLNDNMMQSMLSDKGSGFGLYSINRRIKTIFGNNYGVHVDSSEHDYTNVKLVLPVQSEEEK